jgi:hypothetical protein
LRFGRSLTLPGLDLDPDEPADYEKALAPALASDAVPTLNSLDA